jgi:hypothetical protein
VLLAIKMESHPRGQSNSPAKPPAANISLIGMAGGIRFFTMNFNLNQ